MSHVNLLCGVGAGPVACELADPHSLWQPPLGATKRARRSSKRSTTPTNTAIPTIRIRGAHKPRDNRARDQESPPNREPRGRANRCTADTTAARTRTLRHNRTRQAAASMVRRTDTRLTDTTAHNARRRRLTSHEHTTLLRRGTNAADLADSSPASDATGEQRHRRAPEAGCPYQAKRSPAHRACGHSRPHNETPTFNTNYPAPTRRKITTKPTRFIRPTRFVRLIGQNVLVSV